MSINVSFVPISMQEERPFITFLDPFFISHIDQQLARSLAEWLDRSLGSQVRVPLSPCGFRGGRIGVGASFSLCSPVFPCFKFHFTTFSIVTSFIIIRDPQIS